MQYLLKLVDKWHNSTVLGKAALSPFENAAQISYCVIFLKSTPPLPEQGSGTLSKVYACTLGEVLVRMHTTGERVLAPYAMLSIRVTGS